MVCFSFILNEGTFELGSNEVQYSSYCLNWMDEKENKWEEIESGKLTILNNDEAYEIIFECTTQTGESISGYYNGNLQYFTLE